MKDNKYITRDRKLEIYTGIYAFLMLVIVGLILIYPDDTEYVGILTLTWITFTICFFAFREQHRHTDHLESIIHICNILDDHESKLVEIDRMGTEIVKVLKEYQNNYVEVEIKDE